MNTRRLITNLMIAGYCCLGVGVNVQADDEMRFDVNDVAILWPVPTTPADLDKVISAGERLRSDMDSIWPQAAFEQMIEIALSTAVDASSGTTMNIAFNQFEVDFKQVDTWRIASLRLDPSAPGTHADSIRIFGSRPQIRLVVQPVTVQNGSVKVHDFTAHLVFDFVASSSPAVAPGMPPRANPDKSVFQKIVEDFTRLKLEAGVDTRGPLGIHPGIEHDAHNFNDKLRAILSTYLDKSQMTSMAFMGIQRPEPWIFVGARKVDGQFKPISHPSLGGHGAQMFSRRGGDPVMPNPVNRNLGTAGVGTATLFTDAPLVQRVFEDSTDAQLASVRVGDIPDIVENPLLSSVATTDCVSCHTASSMRTARSIPPGAFAYQLPDGISGVDETLLPNDSLHWNVRAFGWGHPAGARPVVTITMRTANEAAESASFINREYLAEAPANSVSHPLTLIAAIKSEEHLQNLKVLVTNMQNRPPAENPISLALDRLGMVHFARFVILEEEMKLAVITSFDGDLDTYVQAFADEIGPIFDQLFQHLDDAPPSPVAEHPDEFLEFVKTHNRPVVGTMYSAYPNLSTQDILTLQREAE